MGRTVVQSFLQGVAVGEVDPRAHRLAAPDEVGHRWRCQVAVEGGGEQLRGDDTERPSVDLLAPAQSLEHGRVEVERRSRHTVVLGHLAGRTTHQIEGTALYGLVRQTR